MNLFELFVKIGVDDQASGKLKDLGGKLGNGLKTAAKIGTAAVGAAAAGITALTTAAVNNYAEYEQLVGGVETLFKDSAEKVQEYAANAYKTAGMSANEYMSTVTSFSASLLQSLGGDTEAAAEYANQALTDMSDNANKMGTDMSLIQNAYQGFAKANYTMLDNLKLGYGGTQSEMQRLIADAAELSDTVDAQDMSFANIVKAINVVQTEMGITGTTAKEASSTIQGSLSSMKSAWQNLTVGIADENANIDTLIDNFVNSVVTVGDNLLPRIQKIIGGIGTMVQKLAPIVGAAIPQLVTTILPPMIQAGISLVNSLLAGIRENLDAITTGAVEIVMMLLEALGGMIPELIMMGVEILVALIDGIASKPDTLVKTAITLISTLCKGLLKALPEIARAATELMAGLISSIVLHLPEILMTGTEIILSLVSGAGEALYEMMKLGVKVVQKIIDGIASAWGNLVSWFNNLWDNLFGRRDVNVNVNTNAGSNAFGGGGINGSHANGLDYVPFNGYIAELHRGESVLTAAEAQRWRSGQPAYAGAAQPITIPITLELDGAVLARKTYRYNQTEIARHGKSFVR